VALAKRNQTASVSSRAVRIDYALHRVEAAPSTERAAKPDAAEVVRRSRVEITPEVLLQGANADTDGLGDVFHSERLCCMPLDDVHRIGSLWARLPTGCAGAPRCCGWAAPRAVD
jgi:hypothetical protein